MWSPDRHRGVRAQLPQCPRFVPSQSPCLSFKAISAPHPWFKGGGGERWHRHETDTGPSPDPTPDTSGSSSPSLLHGRAFHIQTSLDLQHSPGVLLIPAQHLKLVSELVCSQPSLLPAIGVDTTTPGVSRGAAAQTLGEAALSLPRFPFSVLGT